ncbi:MgtC/SapB family protein [Agrobacterium sp. NPDC090283]|uniref:MgtC/SapB family protein n=1 Tax=Agrobacterium sp. NPDC090283 TaxID=3363920 RepID=UPI00383B883C
MINDFIPWLYDTLSISARLIAAVVFGTVIGLERQWRQGATGLTTHALVAFGAAAYCALPAILEVNEDIRMGGQVVTGIGFLGAGLIMRDGLNIRGLSTSATVWATGAIGVLAGYGRLFEATEATLLILLINMASPKLVRLVERFVPHRPVAAQQHTIEVRTAPENEAEVRARLMAQTGDHQLAVKSLARRVNSTDQTITIDVVISGDVIDSEVISALVQSLSLSPTVLYCAYR